MLAALAVLIISVGISAGTVAIIISISHKKGWYDRINERKVHTGTIPRLGGIGFSFAFLLVMAIIGIIYTVNGVYLYRYIPCGIAILIVLFTGIYDDFRPLKPSIRFIFQLIAALCVVISGFDFDSLLYSGPSLIGNLGAYGYIISVFWIIGLINAVNMVDGLDALAGGISLLIALFLGLIFYSFSGFSKSVYFCICLVGIITGFLFFNAPFPKAKIFMGDGGSYFLGLTLAMLPMIKETNSAASLPVLYAAALFSIPIFDTTAAVWRRLRDRQNIFKPDRAHLHHKLIGLGLSTKGVLFVILSLQLIIGILVFTSVRLTGVYSLVVLGIVYLITLSFFITVHFLNRASIKKKGINSQEASPPPPCAELFRQQLIKLC